MGRGAEGSARETTETAAAGRTTRSEALPEGGASAFQGASWEALATPEDAATSAVASKRSGRPLDETVRAKVEAHLGGVRLDGVRVHDDAHAHAAAKRMGARAFTYGQDVFLGAGESEHDLGLMAHELTHVAQQTGGAPKPQRKVTVGSEADPAETHADAIASQVTSGATPATLLVDRGPPAAGQMVIAQFLPLLRSTVASAVEQELGKLGAAAGCPWIEKYFHKYEGQPAAAGEALLRRWIPSAKDAANAQALLALVGARVRAAVKTWDTTGKLPADLAAADPEVAAAAREPAKAQKQSLEGLESDLGTGSAVDGEVARRMTAATGTDVSSARVHTGPVAAAKAAEHGAAAFAVGNNVVMGAGAPGPGSPIGDALLAHELAHVAQQRDAATDPQARKKPIGEEDKAAETDADRAAERGAGKNLGDIMKTGLNLQRCGGVDPAYEPKKVEGPDVGRLVATGAPGKAPWYNEHPLQAGEAVGVVDDEAQAIALAKTLGRPIAVVPNGGRFYLYNIKGETDVLAGTPLDLQPGYVGNAGLRVEAGVVAIVNHYGAVYRGGDMARAEEVRAPIKGASADPWAPYKALNKDKGGIDGLSEPELLATFQAAMADTALAVLASSEIDAQTKATQFSTANATSAGEHQEIEETAKDLLPVLQSIESTQAAIDTIKHTPGDPDTHDHPPDWFDDLPALQDKLAQLKLDKRRKVARYPMLGRYDSASALSGFMGKKGPEREAALAGDAKSVLSDLRETRKNIQSGDLNLWDVPSVVDATMAGLGIEKGSPQRAKVETKVSKQKTKETVLSIALAVFSIGFGIAGAVFTGGTSLAFAAGALGLGAYDAIKTTEEHFIKNAATNTSTDPAGGLLPAEARQHWGWLVVAWAGVALDFADVLKAAKIGAEVGKVAKGAQSVEQAAEALAAGDKKLLERLRKAAGEAALTDNISEALRPGLSGKIGAEITVDGNLGSEVRVMYTVDEAGRSAVVGVKVGPAAKVGDIVAHAETVKALNRYSGVTGRAREIWDRMRSFVTGKKLSFELHSKAHESYLELEKLDRLIAMRRGLLTEMLQKSPNPTEAQAALRKEIAFLENEVDIHQRVLDGLVSQKGAGFVAMSDGTQEALRAGHRLPDVPTKGFDEITPEDLKNSAYYFERQADGSFVQKTKLDRAGGAAPVAPTKAAPAPLSPEKLDELRKTMKQALQAAEGLSEQALVQLEKLPAETLKHFKGAKEADLEKLGAMLASDPDLAGRMAGRKNLFGSLRNPKVVTAQDMDLAMATQRLGDLGVKGDRVIAAVKRSGLDGNALAKLTDADLKALGEADVALAKARALSSPGDLKGEELRAALASTDKISDAAAGEKLRSALSHAHGLSDVAFLVDPGAALAKRFPQIPKSSMDELVKRHPDALRALEAATEDDVRKIIRALGESSNPKDVEDILRSYMYKAQKKARKGTTDGMVPPENVGTRIGESLENLATVRQRGFPFGFKDRAQYDQFMSTMDAALAKRNIQGKAHVQGSAMHSKTPGDIDVEILVDQAHFDELAKGFLAKAKSGIPELKQSIKKQKIPSYQFYPDANPSVADAVKPFTSDAAGATMDVQATLIVRGSDFDLGPHL